MILHAESNLVLNANSFYGSVVQVDISEVRSTL